MIHTVNKGDSFKCIKDFEMTGRGRLFTKGQSYKSDHINCLTNNYGVNTIVISGNFDINKYFKR